MILKLYIIIGNLKILMIIMEEVDIIIIKEDSEEKEKN